MELLWKWIVVHFSFKIWHLVATILMIFLRLNLPIWAKCTEWVGDFPEWEGFRQPLCVRRYTGKLGTGTLF